MARNPLSPESAGRAPWQPRSDVASGISRTLNEEPP
jgi:hypothetical protein